MITILLLVLALAILPAMGAYGAFNLSSRLLDSHRRSYEETKRRARDAHYLRVLARKNVSKLC